MTTASGPAPLPEPLHAAARDLAAGVARILANLAALIAAGLLRDPLRVIHIIPLCNYLSRTTLRFTRLMDRLASGRPFSPLRAPRLRAASGEPRRRPRVLLPRARHWLINALGYHASGYAVHLKNLLDRPEAQAILAANPAAAARILNPVRHLLGLAPLPAIPPLPTIPQQRASAPTPPVRPAAPPPAQPRHSPADPPESRRRAFSGG